MRMTTLLVLVGALLVGPTGRAAGKDKKPKKDKTKATVKDICKDCVDPYNSSAERARFLTAAGVDSELDAKEFETDKARDDGFIRKFDSWKGMLVFDKDSNSTLDWFEADAYRRDIRKRVLLAYDANKDGRLKDKERKSANKALSKGKVPKASKKSGAFKSIRVPGRPLDTRGGARPPMRTAPLIISGGGGGRGGFTVSGGATAGQLSDQMRLRMFDKNKDGKLDDDEKAAMAKWEEDNKKRREEWTRRAAQWRKLNDELRKKHDKNGDGQLDGEERKAYYEEYREQAKIIQWDKDGDGRLSDAERKEMETKQAEWKKRSEENRRKWLLQRWDKNKDGELDQDEHKAMDAEQAKQRKRNEEYRRQWELRRWDKNKDGELDKDERKTMEQERSRWRQPGSAIINVSPAAAGGGGGVRVWNSRDGSVRSIIIRRGGQDEQDQ